MEQVLVLRVINSVQQPDDAGRVAGRTGDEVSERGRGRVGGDLGGECGAGWEEEGVGLGLRVDRASRGG